MRPSTRFFRSVLCVVSCMALGTPSRAFADPPGVSLTRADLAAVYLRFERTLRAHPPGAARVAEANRQFDQATLAFFAGDNAGAIKTINALTASLLPESARGTPQRFAASLKVRMEPRTFVLGRPAAPIARITSMYAVDAAPGDVGLTLRLRHRAHPSTLDTPLPLTVRSEKRVDLVLPLNAAAAHLAPGWYDVSLVAGGDMELPVSHLAVVPESLDAVRKANEVRLAAIKVNTPALQQALASCRARNRLLTDTPSEDDSAQFLADPSTLVPRITAEIDALTRGKNPYHRRAGDTWRVLNFGDTDIPLRLYAPAAAATNVPMPLVIALHGAGGDENMFLDGYGAGLIKQLADQQGFLVASPLAYLFGASPAMLDRLVKILSHDYAIDADRIYVLGHSMGAGVTAGLARSRHGTIAAACCLAGGGFFRSAKSLAPTLVFGAELDPLANAATLRTAVQAAAANGLPIEFRRTTGYGHTLMVGAVLPDATKWLLSHRRGAASRPATASASDTGGSNRRVNNRLNP